ERVEYPTLRGIGLGHARHGLGRLSLLLPLAFPLERQSPVRAPSRLPSRGASRGVVASTGFDRAWRSVVEGSSRCPPQCDNVELSGQACGGSLDRGIASPPDALIAISPLGPTGIRGAAAPSSPTLGRTAPLAARPRPVVGAGGRPRTERPPHWRSVARRL